MKKIYFAAIASALIGSGAAFAQEAGDPIAIATESGVCGDSAVISAVYIDSGAIEAICDGQATAFVPAAGPVLGVLGAGLLAAMGGGNGTGSTGSTSGTN